MSYTVTKNNKDHEACLADIDAYTSENVWQEVFSNMYPMHEYENSNTEYVDESSYYDSIQIYQMVSESKVYGVKLLFDDYQTAFNSHIQSLKDAETAWFDEAQRVNDLGIRLDALNHWKGSANIEGSYASYSNYALFKRDLIEADDTVVLAEIEAQNAILEASHAFEASVDAKQEKITKGLRVIAYISQLNEDNNITDAQMITLYSDEGVKNILLSLQTGALGTALTQVQALDLTGLEPITGTERTIIVNKLQEYNS